MSVDISNLTIAVPVAESSISTVAVELTGSEAIALYPNYVKVLSDGSVQLSAPTKALRAKAPAGPAASGRSRNTGPWAAPWITGIARK